jgi:CrcB protein
MNMLVAIALGGGIGALGRHFLSSAVVAIMGSAFPWGIFVVNILGGFLMGLIVELGALKIDYSLETRAFLTTGLLGGFTTFSAFSLDASLLIERGEWMGAMLYVAGSALLSIVALFAGLWLVRSL